MIKEWLTKVLFVPQVIKYLLNLLPLKGRLTVTGAAIVICTIAANQLGVDAATVAGMLHSAAGALANASPESVGEAVLLLGAVRKLLNKVFPETLLDSVKQ